MNDQGWFVVLAAVGAVVWFSTQYGPVFIGDRRSPVREVPGGYELPDGDFIPDVDPGQVPPHIGPVEQQGGTLTV